MKYLKHFNESLNTMDVQDVFQELFDEYDIYECEGSNNSNGFVYRLDTIWKFTTREYISLIIFEVYDRINNNSKLLKIYEDCLILVDRLKRMGYKVSIELLDDSDGEVNEETTMTIKILIN